MFHSYNGNGAKTLTVGAANGSGTFSGVIHGSVASGGTDGAIEQGILNLTKSGTQLIVRDTFSAATSPRRFIRLRVEALP